MNDPVVAIRRSTRTRVVVGAVAVVGVWAWALLPTAPRPLALAEPQAAQPKSSEPARVALDTTAFSAPLWTVPPPAPQVAAAPPKPAIPPLKLQLIGISSDTPAGGGEPVLHAALYDPDSDKLFIVAAGETIHAAQGRVTVSSLSAGQVELAYAQTTRTLSLKDERRAGP